MANKKESATVLPFPHQIESAGVDWITLTQHRTRASETLYDRGHALVCEMKARGDDVSNWRFQGYRGLRCGGVSIGLRGDGYIVQLRSDTARERALEMMPAADNVSRLDVQVTARLTEAQPSFIRNEYARLRRGRRRVGRPVESTLIDSRARGSSLYLGRRSSDAYARLYDKGAEERSAGPGIALRWEVELKRRMAVEGAARLKAAQSYPVEAASIVCAHFAGRGVRTVPFNNEGLKIPRAPQAGDASRRLQYLRLVVAPMVDRLLLHYPSDTIMQALGLDDETMKAREVFKRRGEG